MKKKLKIWLVKHWLDMDREDKLNFNNLSK